jgi:hypothetical protein
MTDKIIVAIIAPSVCLVGGSGSHAGRGIWINNQASRWQLHQELLGKLFVVLVILSQGKENKAFSKISFVNLELSLILLRILT